MSSATAQSAPPYGSLMPPSAIDTTTVRLQYVVLSTGVPFGGPAVQAQIEHAAMTDPWCLSGGQSGTAQTVAVSPGLPEMWNLVDVGGLPAGISRCFRLTLTNPDGRWSSALTIGSPLPSLPPIPPITIPSIPSGYSKGTTSPGTHPLCAQAHPKDKCSHGNGRQTPGGGEKVSHRGWPKITGVFWQVQKSPGRTFVGGELNDELLGHHGSDTITGKAGKDVIWGDWDPYDNNTWQKDRLDGGAGNDWIYSSHGTNTIDAGAGKDLIWAYYGKGTIDCGPGFDTLRIRLGGANRYTHRNCERIKNFCAHGTKAGNAGGCFKPGEDPRRRS